MDGNSRARTEGTDPGACIVDNQVIKLPGFGGSMVSCFAAQLYGEKMNLPDEEAMMYKPSEQWTWWFMRVQMHLSMRKVCGAPVSPQDMVKQDKLHKITLQRLAIRIDDGLDP